MGTSILLFALPRRNYIHKLLFSWCVMFYVDICIVAFCMSVLRRLVLMVLFCQKLVGVVLYEP